MRVLALDHFFDQDLEALRVAMAPTDELHVIPYQRLHRLARRHFPGDAFHGLDAALHVSDDVWRRYRCATADLADWWSAAYRPTLFVAPTDTIFYLRPVIERFASIDVPTVVVQKETTISPMVMDEHSESVRRTMPSIAAAMTVCSERNRLFWVRAGTPAERIVVTGQPRFDVYASPVASPGAGERHQLLYLSYDDAAYLPSDVGLPFEGSWRDLRRETEVALAEVARQGHWRVVAKRHPQQAGSPDWLGPLVDRAPQGTDTRKLIRSSTAVVGFQTTAIWEAVVADKPVLYPAWGAVYEQNRDSLLRFDEEPGVVTTLGSAATLADALAAPPESLPRPTLEARSRAEEHLGPVDGRSAERVLAVLRAESGPGPAGWRPPSNSRRLRCSALALPSPVLRLAAAMADGLGRRQEADAARRRAVQWSQEAREAILVSRR